MTFCRLWRSEPAADRAGASMDALVGVDEATAEPGDTDSATTGISIDAATAGGSNSSNITGVTVNSAGSGDAIDNRPKTFAVYYFMKARA